MDSGHKGVGLAVAGRPYLNTAQAAHFLGIGARKLMSLRVAGQGPAFRRHRRLIFYHVDDIEACGPSWNGGLDRSRVVLGASDRCRPSAGGRERVPAHFLTLAGQRKITTA